jgi:chemotaxis signal transduction protein
MAEAGQRVLVFRLGKIAFMLDLAQIVEIVEQTADILDPGRSDISRGIVSALQFRQTWVPVVDPALKLDIFSPVALKDKVAIILRSSEGNWALLVDGVSELQLAENFQPCEIPFLLQVSASGFYSEVRLLKGKPVVVFEPESYYGSAPVVA